MDDLRLTSLNLPGINENKRPLVIAGPCSAETEEQVMTTARQLAEKRIQDIPCRCVETAYQAGRIRRYGRGRITLAATRQGRNRHAGIHRSGYA